MVANFKLTKNVILFLNGGIDMRKKSFIKIMISLCMIIMLVVPFKTSAKSNRSGFGDDSISLIFQHIEDIFVHNVKCVSMIR